jgi:WD40 repeat protein
VTIVDLKNLKKNEKTVKVEKNFPTSISFNLENTLLACGTYNGALNIYDIVNSPTLINTYNNYSKINMLKFSHFNNNLLAYTTIDGGVTTYDANVGKMIIKFNDHSDYATGICYSSVNKLLLCSVGLDCKINFYDVAENKSIKPIIADSPLTAISFAPDGYTIAVGTTKGAILIYDLRKTDSSKDKLIGHKTQINYLDFSKKASKISNTSQSSIKLPESTVPKASRSPSREVHSMKENSVYSETEIRNISLNNNNLSKLTENKVNNRFSEDKKFETFNVKKDSKEMITQNKPLSYTNLNEFKKDISQSNIRTVSLENPEKLVSFQSANFNAPLIEKKEVSLNRQLATNNSINESTTNAKSFVGNKDLANMDIEFTKTKRKNEPSSELDNKVEQFIKTTIQTEMFKLKQYIHDEISSLHVDIIRQFEIQHVSFV